MATSRLQNDLTGQTFSSLYVERHIGNARYECRCKCGNIRIVRGWDLTHGSAKACLDCVNRERSTSKLNDLTGKKFGKLLVIEYLGHKKWKCQCDCGNIVEIFTGNLTRENGTRSCLRCSQLKQVKNYAGERINNVTIQKYLGDSKWQYICNCGNTGVTSTAKITSKSIVECPECRNKHKRKALEGTIVGDWEVLAYVGGPRYSYRCKCLNCGKIEDVPGYNLRSGHSKSCGCNQLIDLTGKKINEYTVIGYAGDSRWLCKCSCGNLRVIHGYELRSRAAKSCGCKKWEYTRKTLLDRYGEVAPIRIGNPRSAEQIEIASDKSKFREMLLRLPEKPTSYKLADILGMKTSRALRLVHKFECDDLVKLFPSISSGESELYEYIKTLTTHEVIQSDRSVLNGRELDIYIPDLKIAIEFNGVYWHSDIYKSQRYHQQKTLDCLKQGVRLIHIFEYEWINPDKQDKIKIYLADVIGEHSEIYYARNLNIREPSVQESVEFLDKYHLQGYTNAPIRYGLYNDTEMLGIITFGKPRFSSNYEYELIRLCWKPGVNVVGGFERLFKHFVTEHNPSSIVTYSDISKFTGNSYLRVGFKASIGDLTSPNYVWVGLKDYSTLSRYQTQKHKLIELGLGDVGDTEASIMENLGYIRMYDCGNLRLSWYKQ